MPLPFRNKNNKQQQQAQAQAQQQDSTSTISTPDRANSIPSNSVTGTPTFSEEPLPHVGEHGNLLDQEQNQSQQGENYRHTVSGPALGHGDLTLDHLLPPGHNTSAAPQLILDPASDESPTNSRPSSTRTRSPSPAGSSSSFTPTQKKTAPSTPQHSRMERSLSPPPSASSARTYHDTTTSSASPNTNTNRNKNNNNNNNSNPSNSPPLSLQSLPVKKNRFRSNSTSQRAHSPSPPISPPALQSHGNSYFSPSSSSSSQSHTQRQRQGTFSSSFSRKSRSRSASIAGGANGNGSNAPVAGIANALALSGAALAHSSGAGLRRDTTSSNSSATTSVPTPQPPNSSSSLANNTVTTPTPTNTTHNNSNSNANNIDHSSTTSLTPSSASSSAQDNNNNNTNNTTTTTTTNNNYSSNNNNNNTRSLNNSTASTDASNSAVVNNTNGYNSQDISRDPSLDSDVSSYRRNPYQDLRTLASFAAFDDDFVGGAMGTGYAVASSKRQADFHALFRNSVPEDDYLIDDIGCALQREILVQGRLYISENHLCFNANILGWITSLVIPFADVITVEKRMTAYVIPNAIQVTTMHARHSFASFLSRDSTYDLITSVWRTSHPVVPTAAALPDSVDGLSVGPGSDTEDDDDDASVHQHKNLSRVTSNEDDTNSLMTPQPTQRVRKRDKVIRIRRRLTRSDAENMMQQRSLSVAAAAAAAAAASGPNGIGSPNPSNNAGLLPSSAAAATAAELKASNAAPVIHPSTNCQCPEHFTNVALDAVFPSTPEKIYNLMFTSTGFMRNFFATSQRLTDIEISDWAPSSNGGGKLSRTVSYVKPMNAAVGPKSVQCIITDEAAHVDFDDYITTVTTTRTPDVPSGGSFSVKTKTCIMWRPGNMCRVLVTTQVDWTKSSFFKGVITSSSIDGQKKYHNDLDTALRNYIKDHPNEFASSRIGAQDVEGQGPDGVSVRRETEEEKLQREAHTESTETESLKQVNPNDSHEQESSLSSIAKALDIAKNLPSQVSQITVIVMDGVRSVTGEASPLNLILAFVVLGLVLSNLWTLFALRGTSGSNGYQVGSKHRSPPPMYIGLSPQLAESVWYGANNNHDDPSSITANPSSSSQTMDVARALRDALTEYFGDDDQQLSCRRCLTRSSSANSLNDVDNEVEFDIQDVGKMQDMLEKLEKRIDSLKHALRDVHDSKPSS